MRKHNCGEPPKIREYGCEPFIFNIDHATESLCENSNKNKRTDRLIFGQSFAELRLQLQTQLCRSYGDGNEGGSDHGFVSQKGRKK